MNELPIIWKNRFFNVDFSKHAPTLQAIQEGTQGEATALSLLTVLQDMDPDGGWIADRDHDKDMNVDMGLVVYNGGNHPDLPTNARFNSVLRVDFGQTGGVPSGIVNIHYNV